MSLTVGIMHPGAMGVAVAQTMVNSGLTVLWAGNGRSTATHDRAETAGLTDVHSLAALCAQTDTVVSVCPPHAAVEVADAVIAQQFSGTFVDANAISPQKSDRIQQKMAAAGINYVDGGIVGGPPRARGQTWLYLSGPQAAEVAQLFAGGPLETELLGAEIGKASALKMCFAANTKGSTALLAMILGAAEMMEVRAALERQWERYNPGFADNTQQRVQRTMHGKAWRFAGEMDEMVETFAALGLPEGFHAAAAQIYRTLAHFKEAPELPEIETILAALARRD